MMLRISFNLTEEAEAVEQAVRNVLDAGYRTGDILDRTEDTTCLQAVGTSEMTGQVVAALKEGRE